MTANLSRHTTYLTLIDAQDAGFEVSGELRTTRQAQAESLRADDAERPYVLRIFNRILLLPVEYRGPILNDFLARECLDCRQRAETERAQRATRQATEFKRAENGAIDQVLSAIPIADRTGRVPRALTARRVGGPGAGPEEAA